MDTRDIQNWEEEEMTIDLGHFALSIAKRWKRILALTLAGALVGAALNFLPKGTEDGKEPERSREDAALVEQMTVAANARSQYDQLNRYLAQSPFMKLDSQNVFTGTIEYYIPLCADPDQIVASSSALLKHEALRETMCGILGISDEADLDKMFWHGAYVQSDPQVVDGIQVEIRQKVSLSAGVYAATREQAQQAVDFLASTMSQLPSAVSPKQDFQLVEISRQVQAGVASPLREAQNQLRDELSKAHENYTKLESSFDEEQFDLYQEYVLTGRTGELPLELFPSNPLKKPVILAVVFAFLGCGWYAVAYLVSGKAKTADQVREVTRRNVLAFVDRKPQSKNPLDRWLDQMGSKAGPAPVDEHYVAALLGKLDQPVVVYDKGNATLDQLAKALPGIRAMGLVSRDSETLRQLAKDAQLVLLVQLEDTPVETIRQEKALCQQYGLDLVGSVVVR